MNCTGALLYSEYDIKQKTIKIIMIISLFIIIINKQIRLHVCIMSHHECGEPMKNITHSRRHITVLTDDCIKKDYRKG